MSETIYNTLWELFEDIRGQKKKTGSEIIHCSDPKRLLIGWLCNDNLYFVRLTSIQTRTALKLPFENDSIYKLITRLIVTTDGRQQLSSILNCDSDLVQDCFERMLKLKAFW